MTAAMVRIARTVFIGPVTAVRIKFRSPPESGWAQVSRNRSIFAARTKSDSVSPSIL